MRLINIKFLIHSKHSPTVGFLFISLPLRTYNLILLFEMNTLSIVPIEENLGIFREEHGTTSEKKKCMKEEVFVPCLVSCLCSCCFTCLQHLPFFYALIQIVFNYPISKPSVLRKQGFRLISGLMHCLFNLKI